MAISGINGASSCCSQQTNKQQEVIEIDGQQITLTGNPGQDAKNAAQILGCDEQTAAQKIEAIKGKPQQQQQKCGGIGSTQIGNLLAGY